MAYGSNISSIARQVASYVDRMLKGRAWRRSPWSTVLLRRVEADGVRAGHACQQY